MLDLHLLEDGGSVVGDGHVAVGTHQHLVHTYTASTTAGQATDTAESTRYGRTFGSQGGAEEVGDGSGGEDVGLLRVEALDARLLLLLAQDDERPPVLVEYQTHGLCTAKKFMGCDKGVYGNEPTLPLRHKSQDTDTHKLSEVLCVLCCVCGRTQDEFGFEFWVGAALLCAVWL
jgi:hypothetical protein